MAAHACPVCGHCTIDEPQDWDICPICFWEDDVLPEMTDASSPANRGLTLIEGQANYLAFGAALPHCLRSVRDPRRGEEREDLWAPHPEAERLANALRTGAVTEISSLRSRSPSPRPPET